MFCTRRGLKVRTKMNAITTEGFSLQHNVAAARFEVKITSRGGMKKQGGFLLEPAGQGSAEELTPKMSLQRRDLPNLCLNCSPAKTVQICSSGSRWREGAQPIVPENGNVL